MILAGDPSLVQGKATIIVELAPKSHTVERVVTPENSGAIQCINETARYGDTVSFTTQAANGYYLADVRICNKNGDVLDVPELKNGGGSFVMPDEDVVIKANFIPFTYSIQTKDSDHVKLLATDENGNQKPLVSITQTSDFRVKGSISEMGSISEGTNVIVRSRINENQVYKGTVTKVETDPQSNSNNNVYGNDSNESASKYPFYVTLDNNKGLKLGQHVYIEVDNGQSTKKKGIWLDASFIVSDDNGNSYVWVSEKGKLKKRKVELGKTDEETFTTKIKSGLSENDYIAWADDSYSEGMKTTTEYQTETDGDANASKS